MLIAMSGQKVCVCVCASVVALDFHQIQDMASESLCVFNCKCFHQIILQVVIIQ